MEHILNLEQVKKYYGGNSGNITKAVDGISMYVDKGEFVAIMGASGSGKTTLLNCISTIDTVTSGHITVNNQDITKIKDKDFADFRRENLGFIFQDFNLLDTLTIEENISLSLVINKQNPADIDKRVHAIADKLGIRDILSKFPYEVSGGQKQRCACARALINEPKLILADEPTGSVALVQHYPKIIPVMLLSRSTRISNMTERQSVRFSSRVRESYMLLKSACSILSTAEKSGDVSSGASSGIC